MNNERIPPAEFRRIQRAREALRNRLPGGLNYVLAVSGGADSLALAAVCGQMRRDGDLTGHVTAAIVDHQLQPGSAEAAEGAAQACRELGVDRVVIRRIVVPGKGTENDAREARYRELELVRQEVGAEFVLTAHTANDQAEQVLLALARGSGTRAIAGIPDRRGRVLRPFLDVWREDTEAVCEAYGVEPWEDPTNADPEFALRNKVRLELLPEITRILGDGALANLVRTATQARHDAEHLDNEAQAALQACALTETPEVLEGPRASGRAPMQWDLDRYLLKNAPQAIRTRVLRIAAQTVGGRAPTAERTAALERLTAGEGSAGPIQLDGYVTAHRIKTTPDHSVIRFIGRPPAAASAASAASDA